jgi:exodeoxyribonuclease V alpha subunit
VKVKKLANYLYYTGLPILITENDGNRKLFNGDIGLVLPVIDKGFVELRGVFAINQKLVSFALDTLPTHEDAYFLSIHKSQGSEYENLLIYLPPINKDIENESNNLLLNRQIIYTGITRARKPVYLCGSEETWITSLKRFQNRITGFQLESK